MENTEIDLSKITVSEANSILDEKLQEFKIEKDLGKVRNTAKSINDILYGAIIHFPTEVNAVKIVTSIEIERNYEELLASSGESFGRLKLETFLKLYLNTEKIPELVKFDFIKHLPYQFTTDTHGSGQRAAGWASLQNMAALTGSCSFPAYFMIDTADGNIATSEKACFFSDEIKAIQLVKVNDDEFSRNMRYKEEQIELQKTDSAALHYIKFRGFFREGVNERYIQRNKWKQDILKIINQVWISDKNELFQTKDEFFNHSFSGFAVYTNNLSPTLYEFSDVKIPRAFRGILDYKKTILMTYGIVKNNKNAQANIKMYSGDEIINRLFNIESKRKF
jgi:hypothetical protein